MSVATKRGYQFHIWYTPPKEIPAKPRDLLTTLLLRSYGQAVSPGEVVPAHTVPAEWNVDLPHRDDAWEITNHNSYSGAATKQDAIDDLSRFIEEAALTIVALENAPDEPGERWEWWGE